MSAREVIARAQMPTRQTHRLVYADDEGDQRGRCKCGWVGDGAGYIDHLGEMRADAILSALSEAGFTVARLEDAGLAAISDPPNYAGVGFERLYRMASPVAPPVSREAQ